MLVSGKKRYRMIQKECKKVCQIVREVILGKKCYGDTDTILNEVIRIQYFSTSEVTFKKIKTKGYTIYQLHTIKRKYN